MPQLAQPLPLHDPSLSGRERQAAANRERGIQRRKFTATHRPCPDCGETLPLEAFNRNRREASGRQSTCRACQSARAKAWRATNPDLVKQRNADKRRRHRDYYRDYALRTRHGVGLAEKQRMYEAQEGRCAICDKRFENLHLDHCHETGKIRKLLCSNCNRGIGHLQHDIEILRRAVAYLS